MCLLAAPQDEDENESKTKAGERKVDERKSGEW